MLLGLAFKILIKNNSCTTVRSTPVTMERKINGEPLFIKPDELLDSEELIEKKINKGIGIVDNYIYIYIYIYT